MFLTKQLKIFYDLQSFVIKLFDLASVFALDLFYDNV